MDAEILRQTLRSSVDDERHARLQRSRAQLADFRFDVFGTVAKLDSWHHDARDDVHYDRGEHWTLVATPDGADVKRVWEPSRFTWSFDLARLHLIDPGSGAADLFWHLLADWMANNQPNSGVNWGCGQEASFRLLSVIASADAMADSANEERQQLVRRLAVATGRRVAANIDYARSQANNHHASEAMGLLTCGLLFSDHEEAPSWQRVGERHLREVCDRLVFADGGSSQYSTNYHRVFLHDLVWAAQTYRAVGRRVPAWLLDAGARATRFLDAITEPISGSGPFFGPDDGALVLPLSSAPHRCLAADVMLAASCFGVDVATPAASDQWMEPLSWFGLEAPQSSEARAAGGRAFVESFPEMGVHVLASGSIRVYVRATHWRFRPAHDDQLHCDVWIDGVNVMRDAGTATYHPGPNEPGALSGAEFHNGPRPVDVTGMVKASKFLWARWTHADVVALEASSGRAEGVFAHEVGGRTMTRHVMVGDSVTITDTADGPIVATWLIDSDSVDRLNLGDSSTETHGAASDRYGTSTPVLYRTTRSERVGTLERIETLIG